MEIKVFNNVFENKYETFEYDTTKPLLEQVENHIKKETYVETLVECYDSETGETFYAPMVDSEEESSVMILADGRCVDRDYIPNENEVVSVVFLPASGDTVKNAVDYTVGFLWGGIVGTIEALPLAIALGPLGWIAALGGFVLGGLVGIWGMYEYKQLTQDHRSIEEGGKQGNQSPDIRGAENTSLKGNNFPFVIGKHLVTPFIVGDPTTEYTGERGVDAYVRTLLLVGYAPLKLTDFKLGEFWLSYNRDHKIGDGTVITQPTYLSGLLKGYSQEGASPDSGDILDYWKNNDIELEIIQQTNNGNIDYGTIYTEAVDDQQVNANVFYIADKLLDESAQVTYKGVSFPNKFRTNGCWFTASCPKEFTITLDLQNGLYKTYTKSSTSGNTTISQTKYESIPLWVCVQWRPYNNTNPSPKADGSDYDLWNNIEFPVYGTQQTYSDTFDTTKAAADKSAHRGNDLSTNSLQDIYGNFLGKTLQNFQSLGGEDGISEIRVSATVTLTPQQIAEVMADTNTMKAIEVRVLRVSPNYMNELDSSSDSKGPESYSEHIKVISLVTKSFDEQAYINDQSILPVRPLSEKDMRDFCLVAIKAKADASGYLQNQLSQVNCIAESFSPYWDYENRKIMPEGIVGVKKYYGYFDQNDNRVNRSCDDGVEEREVTRAEYEQARQDGFNWYCEDCGSNYKETIKNIVFDTPTTHNLRPAYTLSSNAAKYNNNSVVSGFMLSCIGQQNGPIAVGYERIDLLSIGDWALKTNALKDGTTFNSDTTYNGVSYHKGDEVPIRMEANGYVYSGTKQEDLLQKLALCGRATWCIDDNGKIRVVMDAPVDYTKGVVNAQNCISSTNAFNYEDLPAGLLVAFSDENDGYEQNQFYVWSDGNKLTNYHGQVESCGVEFVTNPYQMWSLGRYILALRLQTREILTRKIGPEGKLFRLGDVVLVQSEDLLIGDCSGRIQEVIEDSEKIYGFVCDAPYEYKAEQGEDSDSTQGVTILQPGYYGQSNAVTLPISMPVTLTVGGKTYTLKKGTTNLVLFGAVGGNYGLPKGNTDPSPSKKSKYNFKTSNICMFGLRDKISAPYRISKIKPEKDGCFTETLVPYDESLYNAGAELPSFQNYITPPQVEEPPITLSETPSTLQEQQNSQNALSNRINGVINGNVVIQAPDKVTTITAKTVETGIDIIWNPLPNNGMRNIIKNYTVSISKDSGSTWFKVENVKDSQYFYEFVRTAPTGNIDGYPEQSDFSTWRIKVASTNIYGETSEDSDLQTVDTTDYGTWIIPQVTTSVEILDRTVVLTAVYANSGRKVYGKIDTLLKIKRLGNSDTVDNTTYNDMLCIQPDSDYHTPEFYKNVLRTTAAESHSPDGNTEFNYMVYTLEGNQWVPGDDYYVSSSNKITHTLPLIGQNPRMFKMGDVPIVKKLQVTPSGTENPHQMKWYELVSGEYVLTNDTTVNEQKTYYADNPVFAWEVPDSATEPANPQVGDMFHYTGETNQQFTQEFYYMYVEVAGTYKWEQVFAKSLMVPCQYEYLIGMTNESYPLDQQTGQKTGVFADPIIVKALPTNIADIVHSHEHYKDLYVEKLSAISANIGLIQQGGFGEFDLNKGNYWALSTLTAEDTGISGGIEKGSFRVGGTNEYFRVTPLGNDNYKIELKAGNIELTTDSNEGMDFFNGTYVYDSVKTQRMALTPTGIRVEKYTAQTVTPAGTENPSQEGWYEYTNGKYVLTTDTTVDNQKTYYINPDWYVLGKVSIDSNNNLIISNTNDPIEFGFKVNGTIYHFEDSAHKEDAESGSNPMGIAVTGNIVPSDNSMIDTDSSKNVVQGTVEKDVSQFSSRVVFFTKANGVQLDRYVNIDGTTTVTPDTYNSTMFEAKGQGTVGSYLGLTSTQINNGIFEEIEE